MSASSDSGSRVARPDAASSAAEGSPRGAPLVLVAEDDEGSRSALLEVLREGGYHSIGVRDGLELVELASRAHPAAVIMDLAMPRLDGIEAASTLRSDVRSAGLRIIAFTASWLAERADLLAAAGFDGGVRKPCTSEQLLVELRRVLAGEGLQQGAGA